MRPYVDLLHRNVLDWPPEPVYPGRNGDIAMTSVHGFTITDTPVGPRRASSPALSVSVSETGSANARLTEAALALLPKGTTILIGYTTDEIALIPHKDGTALAESGSVSGPRVLQALGERVDGPGVYTVPLSVVSKGADKVLVGKLEAVSYREPRTREAKAA